MKKTIQLEAIKGHSYAQKFQTPGSVYPANPKHARYLILLGKSKKCVDPASVAKKVVSAVTGTANRAMSAEAPRRGRPRKNPIQPPVDTVVYDTAEDKTETTPEEKDNTYSRSDITAETE